LTNGSSYPSGHSLGPPLGDSGPPFSEPRCILAKVPLLAPCKARLYSHREAPRFWPLRRIPRHCDDEDPLHLSLRTSSLFVITNPSSLRDGKALFISSFRSLPLFIIARPFSLRHCEAPLFFPLQRILRPCHYKELLHFSLRGPSSFRHCEARSAEAISGLSLLQPRAFGLPVLTFSQAYMESLERIRCKAEALPPPCGSNGGRFSEPERPCPVRGETRLRPR